MSIKIGNATLLSTQKQFTILSFAVFEDWAHFLLLTTNLALKK